MATCCYCHGSEAERESGLVSCVRRGIEDAAIRLLDMIDEMAH
jgi:hypothetical protein